MIKLKTILKRIVLFVSCFLIHNYFLFAQPETDSLIVNDTIHFPSDFFDKGKTFELQLEFDIKQITINKNSEDYLPAIITYFLEDSVEIRKSIQVKSRGIFREEYCNIPPLLLNFKKSEIKDGLPSEVNKIKVVTHCFNSKQYENYLLKEYIAYKLFNIITDYSFKVRLARIKYIDTGRKNKTYTKWAFLIEPENMLAERLNAYPIKMDKMSHNYLDTLNATIMTFFQYMIGNTDFSLTGRHNIKLIKLKDFTKPSIIPIPYDFDFSGFVNTHYASPMEGITIKNVTERYYRGICRNNDTYTHVIDIFVEKKDEIFEFIYSCEYLDKKNKKYVISYIEEFYEEINKPDFIEDQIRTTCF